MQSKCLNSSFVFMRTLRPLAVSCARLQFCPVLTLAFLMQVLSAIESQLARGNRSTQRFTSSCGLCIHSQVPYFVVAGILQVA